jgi:hypothetical protein
MLNKPMFEKILFEIKSHSMQICFNIMLNNFKKNKERRLRVSLILYNVMNYSKNFFNLT